MLISCIWFCCFFSVVYMFVLVTTYSLAYIHYVPFMSEWSLVARSIDPNPIRTRRLEPVYDFVIYWSVYCFLTFWIVIFALENKIQ